ncbi:hypothetical protein AB1283_01980 [Bacillus sp. S13(2024)]|uniref:hypothetical protein n=1 Tax=unclassified Bacillus (in: firmicutes) TaxID=185979 RepID=UPI003D1C38D8
MEIKRSLLCFVTVLFVVLLVSCNTKADSVKTKSYDGKPLHIAVIGKIPEVREKQVKFSKIQFSNLEKTAFDSNYDAVFITRENLSEAAEAKYAPIYKKSHIPFFFIQTTKGNLPFVDESLSYKDAPEVDDGFYAIGIFYHEDHLQGWGYGLYNDIKNEANVKDVYSRIFETISKNSRAD